MLHFQSREISLKWCKESCLVELTFSVSIMLLRWECQSYLLIHQLHELIEIILSACINWNNILYIGEMKEATTKINTVSQQFSDSPWRVPWGKQGNNFLEKPCFIYKGKWTLFLSETGSYSKSALYVNSTSLPSFKCWASFDMFVKSLWNNSHQCRKDICIM